MNKHIGLFIAAAVSLLPVSAQSQTAKDIEGCWSLMSFVIERKGGDRIEPFGPKPIGQYIYTADKHATIFQMRPDLPAGVSGDPKSATDPVVQTYVVYFGPYTLEGKTLTVNIGNGVTR